MKTAIKVTFSAKYTQGLDKLYTYLVKPDHDVQMHEIVVVEAGQGLKRAQVIVIDKQFTEEAEARLVKLYGPLKYAYPEDIIEQTIGTPAPEDIARVKHL